jgi:hypothetical protein
MPNDPDERVRQWFVTQHRELDGQAFISRVIPQIHRPPRGPTRTLVVLRTALAGLHRGLTAPLRVRHAHLMIMTAVAVTLWAAWT